MALMIISLGIHFLVYLVCVIDGFVFWFDPSAVGFKETQTKIYDTLGIKNISIILLIPLVFLVSLPFSFYVYWLLIEWGLTRKVNR